MSHLRNGRVITYDLDPVGLGLRRAQPEDFRGGDPGENARMLPRSWQARIAARAAMWCCSTRQRRWLSITATCSKGCAGPSTRSTAAPRRASSTH